MNRIIKRAAEWLLVAFLSLLLPGLGSAETIIDDFTTPSAPFGSAFFGHAIYDQPISGAGIATSRDLSGQAVPLSAIARPPAQITGGELVMTNVPGSFVTMFVVYDAHGDGMAGAVPTMPGGPYDLSAMTEFRIDVSNLTGSLEWFVFAVDSFGSGAGSGVNIPLVNGVNAISASAGNFHFVDFSSIATLHFGIANYSNASASANLDNFRIDLDLVPEPSSAVLLCLGFGGALMRRDKSRRGIAKPQAAL
jgi:hypothetical protein